MGQQRGKEKEYILGEYLWARYGHLTGPTYNSQNFMINSSDINRTIESAIYFVDGYFSPKNKCNWNDSGVTQDVPIDVIPESLDNVSLYGPNNGEHYVLLNVRNKIYSYFL